MADFVIVGGGVYGCGVAWELAKRGADVQLLEAKSVAGGASGWAIAPAVNQLLAEWAFTGICPKLLAPSSYNRFNRI